MTLVEKQDEVFVALAALSGSKPKLNSKALSNSLRLRCADYFGEFGDLIEPNEAEGTLLFPVGAYAVSLTLVDMPIPDDTLDPIIRNNLLWPDAAGPLKPSRSHAIVAIVGPKAVDPLGLVTEGLLLTTAMCAFSDVLDVSGFHRVSLLLNMKPCQTDTCRATCG